MIHCSVMPKLMIYPKKSVNKCEGISYLDSRVLLLCSVDGDFEVVVVAAVAVFDGDWDLDALSDGFDCCRLCCCC